MKKSEPNGLKTMKYQYLVMLNYAMDDIPLHLFDDRDENVEWPETGVPLSGILDLPDISTPPICTKVVTIRDGVPCSQVVVRSFDGDSDDDQDKPASPEPEPTLSA